MATVEDIRRGDKFTWNGTTYYAMDDARLYAPEEFGDLGEFCAVRLIRAAGLTPNSDGVIDLDMRMLDNKAILRTAPVTIISRGHALHHVTDEVRETVPVEQVMPNLCYVMAARKRAQREVNDLDEQRDHYIRQAIASGARVAELAELTGLSRERIYQVRDGRR